MYAAGIVLAFVAMLGWGFGDFLIQRATRKIGDWEALFLITFFGSIILLPFVADGLFKLVSHGEINTWYVLIGCGLLMFVASLFDFEALRIGKITVVEPIWSTEVIASTALAFLVLGEMLTIWQMALIALLIIALVSVSFKERRSFKLKNLFVEKGVWLAFVAAMTMGSANFLIGWGSRISDPILTNFFINIIITLLTGAYLLYKKRLKTLFKDLLHNPISLTAMSISDNVAWIAFAFAMSIIPIGIAVALSESYIIVAVLLGFIISKEKVQRHQKLGIVLAIFTAVILAVITTQ